MANKRVYLVIEAPFVWKAGSIVSSPVGFGAKLQPLTVFFCFCGTVKRILYRMQKYELLGGPWTPCRLDEPWGQNIGLPRAPQSRRLQLQAFVGRTVR